MIFRIQIPIEQVNIYAILNYFLNLHGVKFPIFCYFTYSIFTPGQCTLSGTEDFIYYEIINCIAITSVCSFKIFDFSIPYLGCLYIIIRYEWNNLTIGIHGFYHIFYVLKSENKCPAPYPMKIWDIKILYEWERHSRWGILYFFFIYCT